MVPVVPDATDRPTIRQITTLEELDSILQECDRAQNVSDDALRAVFETFEFNPGALNLPDDPFSDAYREKQFELYRRISGRTYGVANEASDWIKVEDAIAKPFPYYTESFQTVSDHILALGLIIKTMQLPPGSRVLEFGAGWGNTTLTLARMGYKVTAVDIEARFLEVIRRRSEGMGNDLTLVQGDFSTIASLSDKFDAILFYESFHHCSDHVALVKEFAERLAPDGIVVFASEPIVDWFPMPWGLRLDGQSLWAIRNFGWLELGFQEGYFRELMGRHGWSVVKYVYDVTSLGTIFVAKRSDM
jgi:protein-L-isoaspartate O-methyltransferase